MPPNLNEKMSDAEILLRITQAYADPENYKYGEVIRTDDGVSYTLQPPWIDIDQGEYARAGIKIITERQLPEKPMWPPMPSGGRPADPEAL